MAALSGARADVEREPEPLVLAGGRKKRDPRIEEDLRGLWQRLSNTGPVAHLNAYCFEKREGEIVYFRDFRFECRDNQIVAAWTRKDN